MIVNRQRRVPVALTPLQQFAERARRELRFADDSVTVCLVSDAEIARMNRRFRGKRGPTDVLSFPSKGNAAGRGQGSTLRGAESYAGDIAISPSAARRNARRLDRSLPAELRVLILHGMLHLAGYDHETDRGEMDRIERRLRKRLGVG
ncbi:MAG: rRNA maturation RNase YbeY [Candidatus Acidiferrales bacterium]|jgi:probable rRNA maturation factor